MFENNLIAGVSGQGGGYSIEDSLRFNDNDSAYLSRTPSVSGDRKTWTWSGWVKRGNLGSLQILFAASNESTTQGYISLGSNDSFGYFDYVSTSNVNVKTNALLRDVSGWYHLVVVFDTTQATGSDRVKIYINGTEQTVTYTLTPSLNYEGSINTTGAHGIGREEYGNTYYFDGYMAEINFIDGQALTADDFGQIDATTGEWSPKAYEGTYGTNGFYLPFDGNANDDSGNGNNWTENNLASTDYMIDTPTNNFATLNPLQNTIDVTYFEGNLKTTQTANHRTVTATQFVSSGKWYFEHYGEGEIGVVRDGAFDPTNRLRIEAGEYAYNYFAGNKLNNNVGTAYGDPWGATDITSCALDLDAGTIEFFKNNVSQGIAFTGLPAGSYTFAIGHASKTEWVNFGADSSFAGNKTRQGNTDANGIGDFYYTPPAGYLALCTDNLPEPTIVDSESHFNVVTYTGDSTTNRAITGVGFQPDFVWIKRRDAADGNILMDSVRGLPKNLFSHSTIAENTTPYLSSFDSDGFTLDQVYNPTNLSGGSYVAWCWKAGGTAVTNTDGSVTSQVSANVDAGFSIVSYVGTGSTATVGHGLSQAPEVMIVKNRSATSNFCVYAKPIADISVNNILFLDTTSAIFNNSDVFGALPTATVFTVQTNPAVNASGNDFIAYCFHSVESFSKLGFYVGNGSTDGPFVYTGFKPAFVMAKRTNSTGNWVIIDNERIGYNIDNKLLYPNLSNAESTGGVTMDLLSNGFKPRFSGSDYNASGSTYIYMAFAEHPFKEALAR